MRKVFRQLLLLVVNKVYNLAIIAICVPIDSAKSFSKSLLPIRTMYAKSSRFELIPIRFLLIATIIVMVSISSLQSLPARRLLKRNKRGFAQLKCFGVNDRTKFASLNQVCEECYQLYRDNNLHKLCREDCFQNQIFVGCVDALLLSHEQKKLKEMVNLLNGKKR